MPWKKLKVDRGWPATWQRCGKNASGHSYCVMMEKTPSGNFRWGWTQRADEVDPINGWVRTVKGTAREAKRQAEEHLRYLVGKGGSLGRASAQPFARLAVDAAAAARAGDCATARSLASQMLYRAKTPKERTAVMRVQSKVRSCRAPLGGARRRRLKRREGADRGRFRDWLRVARVKPTEDARRAWRAGRNPQSYMPPEAYLVNLDDED